jgi:hypothetical protein
LAAQRQQLQFQSAVETKLMRICTTMMTIAPGEDRENASLFPQYKTLPKFGSRHLLKSLLSLSGCHPFKRLEYEFCRLKKQWYTAWRHARESVGADGKKWHSHFNVSGICILCINCCLDQPNSSNFSAVCFGFFVTKTHKVLPVIRKCKMQ